MSNVPKKALLPDLDLTPEELSALIDATRDRETLLRGRGVFHEFDEQTHRIACALKKLKARLRARHAAELRHLDG